MKRDHNRGVAICKRAGAVLAVGALLAQPLLLFAADNGNASQTQTIRGEVVDLMCYLDHGAKGEKHKGCAEKCIKSGGPVGLLTSDDQLYLVIGNHEPINDVLASKAAQTVTLKGKVVERNGMKMIENAELEK
ncbi:MAG: hypothetical protein ACREIC_32625 [Limisphaerales bacterium]